ncbi:protein PLASTID MOVEMENT IMPAIRED 1-like isoform X2 [Panicum virgatum]|uniref:protein PLASTID MOVEMENT IMPAIRED 1-like isoform X1 n=1 Tax=Panicum virgatum TaxID=38727 RepID=UPI0019D57B82|nr:protein PLASTID MOVEMENT IMPAIRED 1-like isoform X1 [Panicum virgatum]XP_039785406.1 protein PLASTID MOVEMENT IMPAIRED 1-like isoform X2 [Panicum virgatum]
MAGSGGEVAPRPASYGTSLSDYLDGPSDLHRRAASLAIVRSAAGARDDGPRIVDGPGRDDRRTQSSRRASLSLWRSRAPASASDSWSSASGAGGGKGGGAAPASAWQSWRPVRALAHLGKRRAACLFSVEADAVRGLPGSMEGLRLAVTVRKAEARDGSAVQTVPCRVRGGAADLDETLFVRCNLFFTGGAGTGKPLKLEPRRFVVSVVAVEARGAASLLGAHTVDVSSLVLDSVARATSEGRRTRWVDRTFALSGKAAGGELLLKLGFQLMDDAGLSLYAQAASETTAADVFPAPSRARAHSKNSFSISSRPKPKLSPPDASISPSMRAYKQLLERLRIDENGDPVTSRKPAGDDEVSASTADAGDMCSLPEYEVVDKGVETVKEVVHYQAHRDVLRELDSIAEQIEAIEALMTNGMSPKAVDQQQQQQQLEADEEMVTVEFLRKLQVEIDKNSRLRQPVTTPRSQSPSPRTAGPPLVVPDLGRAIGPAVQTRDGGFLVSMNPFDLPLASRDGPPKLAMQVSRPFVLPSSLATTGFDVLQKMAAAGGADEVRGRLASLGGMDDITGKTPEQVGFEGIAEAVIGGRRTDQGATSSAARSVQVVRKLATALSVGRSERVATGIWSAGDDPETLEEVLAFSLQKLEAMAVDALAVQAEVADEDAPFEVAAAAGDASVFDALVPSDEWSGGGSDGRVTLVAAIQVRDPSRRYEAVGAPMVAVIQSARLLGAAGHSAGRFKVRSLHVGGVQVRRAPSGAGGSAASWGAERQKLTAMQWMLAHGPARVGRRAATPTAQARVQRPDVVWSLSSRVLAGMWLKTVRNPDVRIGTSSNGVAV